MYGSHTTRLSGLRVLLVEDSFLVASSLARMLQDIGCRVVGPFARVADALGAVRAGSCDAGMLDINLLGETSEPVAEELADRGLPFFFMTGYKSPAHLSPRFLPCRRVHKPMTEIMLAEALRDSILDEEHARAGTR